MTASPDPFDGAGDPATAAANRSQGTAGLTPDHAASLARSAVSQPVAEAVARSVVHPGYGSALEFTYCHPDGSSHSVWRLDNPPQKRGGKPGDLLRYLSQDGARGLQVHPMVRDRLADATAPLVVAEGTKQCLAAVSALLGSRAAVVGLNGIRGWSWKPGGKDTPSVALPDWGYIPLRGRDVYLIPDGDAATKPGVAAGAADLRGWLETQGAAVRTVTVPLLPGQSATGLDDFLSAQADRPAALRLLLESADASGGAVARLRDELLDASGLDSIPEPEWLVRGWLTLDTLARVNGEPGAMKSFVALDLAGHVGTGRNWHGQETRQGPVVYLVAEGARGVKKRVRAWEIHHGAKMTGVYFLPRPVQALGEEWSALIALCSEIRPALVVLDTQSRITVGVEENSAREMGEVVQRMEALRETTGACVLVIHHSPKGGDGGRGSSAVLGAVNTEWSVSKRREKGTRGWIVTVENTKEKDAADGGKKTFRPAVVDVPVWDVSRAFTELSTSVVLVLEQGAETRDEVLPELDDVPAAKNETQLEFIMGRLDPDGRGLTKSEIKSAATTRQNGRDPVMSTTSFYRAWNDLEGAGAIANPDGSGKRWRIAAEDDEAL